MRFKVPQFIDIEDKIFGPLTWKQFVFLAGGAGLCVMLYKFLWLPFAIVLIVPVGGLALALAFKKINNKPFAFTMEAAIRYFFQQKLFIWRKDTSKKTEGTKEQSVLPVSTIQDAPSRLSGSKLHDMAWSLDVLDTKKK